MDQRNLLTMKYQTSTTTQPSATTNCRAGTVPYSAPSRQYPPHNAKFSVQRSAFIVLLAVLATIATTTHARVYTRWGGTSDAIGNLTRLGGKVAYTSDIKINNGEGKLTVIGFDDPLNNTAPKIRHILNIPTHHPPLSTVHSPLSSPTTSIHILRGKTTTLRLVLLQLPQASRLLAIAIEQPNTEYNKSQKSPTKHQLTQIPAYPGSTPTFYAESSQTKLRIAMSSSSENIEAIHSFYHSRLQADGWQPYLSDSLGSIPQMTIYQRGSELCYILATPSKSCQTISLLYKQLSI